MGEGSVFIAEDDFTRQINLKEVLEKEGFTVVSETGAAVMEKIVHAKPKVIITDVDRESPGDETRLIEEILGNENLKGSEIVVYTSQMDVSLEVKLRRLKLSNYLTKSENTGFLVESVKRLFSASGEELIEVHRMDGRTYAEEDVHIGGYPPPEHIAPQPSLPEEQTEEQMGEMLGEFSEKVHEALGEQDAETYYNLGVSYMDMGMYGEALKEFQNSMKDDRFRLESASMGGICLRNLKKYREAVDMLMSGLKMAKDNVEQMGFRYELGVTLQEVGKLKEAFSCFAAVYKVDKGYRDAAKRILEIKAKLGG